MSDELEPHIILSPLTKAATMALGALATERSLPLSETERAVLAAESHLPAECFRDDVLARARYYAWDRKRSRVRGAWR